MVIPTSKIKIARQLKTKQGVCQKCGKRALHNFTYEMHQPRLFFLHGGFELKKVSKRCIVCNTKTVLKGEAFEREKKSYKLPKLH